MSATEGSSTLSIPVVAAGDIEVAEQHLGVTFDESRRQILRSNDSFDVQACPGSGKTTLLVAKLAILAAKWPHARRGLCILSHTNVARREIENSLEGTAVGARLLSYPHFVGTIHGFVNEFLALPLLRSEGYQVRLIDDEYHGEYCQGLLHSVGAYTSARIFLEKKERHSPHRTIRSLRYEGSGLRLGSAAGTLPCRAESVSGKILDKIKKEAATSGFWRFDDMFAWADRLVAQDPKVAEFVRWRFPAVFLDETQDTSELQGALLNQIFPASACELRQRFGDSNQAIYDSGEVVATTDRFPASGYRSLPSSQRFGANIAAKVRSLAPDPPSPGLVGEGPRPDALAGVVDCATMPHTVFLFGPHCARKVLPAFGSLLLETFADDVLRSRAFLARAIGRVGRSEAPDEQVPRRLSDYWEAYEPRVAKLDPRPRYFAGYLRIAQGRRVVAVDCAESVRLVVKGICELIAIVWPAGAPRVGQTPKWLWEQLHNNELNFTLLRRLLWEWCIDATTIVEHTWPNQVNELREALGPIIGAAWNSEADRFCQWSMESTVQGSGEDAEAYSGTNRYRFRRDARYVDIDVGTIHSAKGQTHTATLVVETYFKKHDIQDLLDWICGAKCGAGPSPGIERPERMRLIYTAMTRPSHLLCLAMRATSIRRAGVEVKTQELLEKLGWIVTEVRADE